MENHKKISCFSVFLFLSWTLSAQFGIWGGYSSTLVNYGGYNEFRANYNSINEGSLKKPLPNFDLCSGYAGGFEAHAKVFFGELSWNSMKGKAQAEFNNGEKREFQLKTNHFSGGIGLGYAWEKCYVYAVGGLSAGDILLSSSFIYTDGTQSFGSEKILNGNYYGLSLGGYYGISSCIPLSKKLKIMVRFTKCGFSKFDSKYALTDIFGSSETQLSGTPHPDGLPVDYAAYLGPDGGYTYSGKYVGTDLSGWRLYLCLHFQFGNL